MRDIIIEKNYWSTEHKENYSYAREIMIEELNKHQSSPRLLHGDLWAGNYMFLLDGQPALFDPAAFYGDREFDIGVSTVFGGFGNEFYKAYQAELPLKTGYEKRLDFYRLYMLMLHLVKFGESYSGSVDHTLKAIIQKSK
jgi:fructosamine-3-kinase